MKLNALGFHKSAAGMPPKKKEDPKKKIMKEAKSKKC